jgi:hypothetical protein
VGVVQQWPGRIAQRVSLPQADFAADAAGRARTVLLQQRDGLLADRRGECTGEDMKYLVELPVDGPDGRTQVVGVEIEQTAEGLVKVSRPGQVVARAARSLGEMLAAIRPVADNFVGGFAGMANAPDEIGLEFGLSLSADANLVVATSAAQANFKVTLSWSKPGPEAGTAATGAAG